MANLHVGLWVLLAFIAILCLCSSVAGQPSTPSLPSFDLKNNIISPSSVSEALSLENAAYNKTCVMSSTVDSHNCSYAINNNTFDYALSGLQNNSWLLVDLQRQYFVEKIVLWQRPGGSLKDFWLYLSNQSYIHVRPRDMNRTISWKALIHSEFRRSLEIHVQRQGQYVRIQASGMKHLDIAEIQVFGHPAGAVSSELLQNEICNDQGDCSSASGKPYEEEDIDALMSEAEFEFWASAPRLLTSSITVLSLALFACFCWNLRTKHRKGAYLPLPATAEDADHDTTYENCCVSADDLGKGITINHIPNIELHSQAAKASIKPATLNYLFSCPLALESGADIQALDLIGVENEFQLLKQSFDEAARDIRVAVDFATVDSVRSLVTVGAADCLHLSGHGHPHYLTFEDGQGGAHLVCTEDFQNLIQAGQSAQTNLRFVFVNCCHSYLTAMKFVQVGVKHVVALKEDAVVRDEAAAIFTRALYLALAVGKTIQSSFDIAKEAVRCSPLKVFDDADKFILLPAGSDHQVVLWKDLPRTPFVQPDAPFFKVNDHLPLPPEDFIGRNIDVMSIIRRLTRRRLVVISGAKNTNPGIGKSSVAIAVSRYMNLRRMFTNGVVFVPCSSSSVMDLVDSTLWQLNNLVDTTIAPSSLFSPASSLCRSQSASCCSPANHFSVFDAPPAPAVPSLEEKVKQLVDRLKGLRCLIVWDNCDKLVDNAAFHLILSRILAHTEYVRILLTSHQPLQKELGSIKVINYRLDRLSPMDSARLFMRRSNRRLSFDDLISNAHSRDMHLSHFSASASPSASASADVSSSVHPLLMLAEHPVIKSLDGHPIAIVHMAPKLDDDVLLLDHLLPNQQLDNESVPLLR
eukprot:GILJ01002143.1.p1 GENE.GILJ01002143.1~~GILJ01002143.1.p1  ORF type:complete len:862 (-),score=120.58 GILJ01002143.1:493-3078(-)